MNDPLKFQDQKRERRIEYDPEESEADTRYVTIDPDTMSMLKEHGMNCGFVVCCCVVCWLLFFCVKEI